MNIIIFGAGRAGQYLIKTFVNYGHNLTVIEPNHKKCEELRNLYDISIIEQGGIKREIFNKSIFEGCDVFIAVSALDELNMMSCSIVKKLGVKKVIARIRNEDYKLLEDVINFKEMDIDKIINPEKELVRELMNLVLYPNAVDIHELYEGRLIIASTFINEKSAISGKPLFEISQHFDLSNLRTVVIVRGKKAIIPKGDQIFEVGDKVYFIGKREEMDTIFKLAGQTIKTTKDIMVFGSSKSAIAFAKELDIMKRFKVKMVVDDINVANKMSEELLNTLILHGEGTDVEFLKTENINRMDFYIPLNDDDEKNIVSSLLASHLGAKQTITKIEKNDYFSITSQIGLQRCINSSISTSNTIMGFVKHGTVLSSSTLKGIDIDATTLKISENFDFIGNKLKDINFPSHSIVGVISRKGEIIVPTGETNLLINDEIVIFSYKKDTRKVEKMFA